MGASVTASRHAAASSGERLSLGDFVTGAGAVIRDAHLRYRILGDPDLGAENGWIVVFHALTGSTEIEHWWGPVVGAGLPLDTNRHPVLIANLLGSCYGSSGPVDAPDFPAPTTHDMARAHLPLLEHLGVNRIALATGGSLGGMVALAFGTITPVPVDHLVVFAAPAATSPQSIAWNAAQRMAIEADPRWRGGRYALGDGPRAGLAAARAIAMITYRSHLEFSERFGRASTRVPGQFDVEQYLRNQGEKLVARFDARSYITLMQAMDTHDLGDLAIAGARIRSRVGRITGVGIDSDILYLPDEVRVWVNAFARAGAVAEYREIRSLCGHDAFLIEFGQVGELLKSGEG